MATSERVWAPESPGYDAFFNAARGNDVSNLNEALTPDINVNALQGDGFEGEAALHMAARNGNLEMVKFLLAHGADVNVLDRDRDGSSQPLHVAAYRAQPNIVKFLLDSGAEKHMEGFMGQTALGRVLFNTRDVRPEHIETIMLLLDYGFDVNAAGVLFQAARLRDLHLLKLLLDRGARVNPLSPTEYSILNYAGEGGDYDVIKFLLDNGAKVDIPLDGKRDSALLRAAYAGKADVFELLMAHADKATISKNFQALHRAASAGHVALVELTLNQGFDIEAQDRRGRKPLAAACVANYAHPEVVALLLSKGGDVNARDKKGDTPLHLAAWRSDPGVIKLLLQAGADLNARNYEGQTPLIRFASKITGFCLNYFHVDGEGSNPRLEVFKLLVLAGSDVNAKDSRGRTALHALVLSPSFSHRARGKLEAAKLLLREHIDLAAVDVDGKTASRLLTGEGPPELAQLLLGCNSSI